MTIINNNTKKRKKIKIKKNSFIMRMKINSILVKNTKMVFINNFNLLNSTNRVLRKQLKFKLLNVNSIKANEFPISNSGPSKFFSFDSFKNLKKQILLCLNNKSFFDINSIRVGSKIYHLKKIFNLLINNKFNYLDVRENFIKETNQTFNNVINIVNSKYQIVVLNLFQLFVLNYKKLL